MPETIAGANELGLSCISTIRTRAIDSVQAAESGYPGTPVSRAPVAYCLWQRRLRFDPDDPLWQPRSVRPVDRSRLDAALRPAPPVAGQLFEADNRNYILDCRINTLDDPSGVDPSIRKLPGVVGTGLFLGLAPTVVVQRGDAVEVLQA
jgi:Transketolase, thiamine diphosphate binding domain/Ribose 5-phosphate isomerase A (phosphoriboisomerase A)